MKQIAIVLFIYFILHTPYVILVSPVHAAVSNQAPTAVISTDLPPGYENYSTGTTIYFDATKSTDPDGDKLSYKWTFGDDVLIPNAQRIGGATIPIVLRGVSSRAPIINHTFPFEVDNNPLTNNPSSYTVRLEVSDGRLTDTATKVVTPTYTDINIPTTHPFLMVTPDDYEGMRNLAVSTKPFSEIKPLAENSAFTNIPHSDARYWFSSSVPIGSAGLAYILNPSDSDKYKDRLVTLIKDGILYSGGTISCSFQDAVGFGAYMVNLIPAYDVIYDEVSQSDKDYINSNVDNMISDMTVCNVKEWNTYSVNAIWNLFKASIASTQQEKDDAIYKYQRFKNLYMQSMERYSVTDDGIVSAGTGYAKARYNWIREGKYTIINVAEHTNTGIFYKDPRYIGLYEWFWGYAYTPMGTSYMIGDSSSGFMISRWAGHESQAPVHTYQFSDAAAANSLFRWKDHVDSNGGGYQGFRTFEPSLHSFVLMTKNLDTPSPDYYDFSDTENAVSPPSKIFPDGGGYFQENNLNYNSLAGVLYNGSKRVWHTHNDNNSILINGYGEHLLLNSGYYGESNSYGYFSFASMNHYSQANNTVMIDDVEHVRGSPAGIGNGGDFYAASTDMPGWHEVMQGDTPQYGQNQNALQDRPPYSKRGDGIEEGFVGNGFDYASGDTGPLDWSYNNDNRDDSVYDVILAAYRVVPNGRHIRNFIFVHPQDNLNGYFVTLDEVEAYTYDGTHKENSQDVCDANLAYSYSMTGQQFTKCDLPGTISSKADAIVNINFHPNTDTLIPKKTDTFFYTFNNTLRNETSMTDYPLSIKPSGNPDFIANSHIDPNGAIGYTQSLSLNGSEYLTVDDSQNLSFETKDYTVSIWFKTTNGNNSTLMAKGRNDADGYNARLFIDGSGALSATVMNDQLGTLTTVTVSDTNNTINVNDGKWHNATVAVDVKGTSPDDTTKIELYGDGQLLTTNTVNGHLRTNTHLWTVGAELDSSGNPTNYFTGTIDYVKLFNRIQNSYKIEHIMSVQDNGGPILIQDQEEYMWNMSGYNPNNQINDVKLNIALGKVPQSIEFPWGHIAGSTQLGHHFKGNFETDSSGKANIPTVLYPSDPTHAKPDIQRIATANYDGLKVDAGTGLVDYIVAVPFDKPTSINLHNTDIDARSAIFRKGGSRNFLFVKDGIKLLDTNTQIGFESSDPISIHLNNTTGNIVSPGVELTIYDYDITSVSLDGNQVNLIESTPAYAKVIVPRGTFSLSYTNEGQPPPTPTNTPSKPGDTDGDGDVDISDLSTLLATFGSTGSGLSADFDQDQDVDISDLSTLLANFGS